jgi:hypothetical protein
LPDEDAPTSARVTAREAGGALGVDSTGPSALAGSFVAWRRLDDVGSGRAADRRRSAPCTPHPPPLLLPLVGRPCRWLPTTSPVRCHPPPLTTPPRGECTGGLPPPPPYDSALGSSIWRRPLSQPCWLRRHPPLLELPGRGLRSPSTGPSGSSGRTVDIPTTQFGPGCVPVLSFDAKSAILFASFG